VGTVFVAVAGPGGQVCVEKHRFQTDRPAFKQLAAQAALLLLRRLLLGIEPTPQPV
jgi:nicotinamide mononucleotide (NMN) deamidase PncC